MKTYGVMMSNDTALRDEEHSDGGIVLTSDMSVKIMTMREFMFQVDSLEWRISLITESDVPAFSQSAEEYIIRATEMLKLLRDQLEYLDHIRLEHDCVAGKTSKDNS